MAVKRNQPITEAITKIEQCLTEVTDWYGKNQLKLNTEKSEAVIFLTKTKRNDLPCNISVTIDGHRVVPKPSVRNLGVILDSGLTMQAQVAQIAKCCYHQIRNIGQIRSRAQSTVDFPIGGHVNVLSDYKETGPEKKFTAVMSLIC